MESSQPRALWGVAGAVPGRSHILATWVLPFLQDPASLNVPCTTSGHPSQGTLPFPFIAVVIVPIWNLFSLCSCNYWSASSLKVGVGSYTSFHLHHLHPTQGLRDMSSEGSYTQILTYIQLCFLFQGLYLLPVQKSASTCKMTPSFKSMALRKWALPNAFSRRRKWKHSTFHYKVGLDLIWCW